MRDSVVVVYGCFAFIVIGLLLQDARRIDTILRYYGFMLVSFPAITVGFWLTRWFRARYCGRSSSCPGLA